MSKEGDDEHAALKSLMQRIKQVIRVTVPLDCASKSKSRIIVRSVGTETWYMHAQSRLSFHYNVTEVVDVLYASIEAV